MAKGLAKGVMIAAIVLAASMAYVQELRLTIQIKTAQAAVKNGQDVEVSTTIRNTGKETQTVRIWSCSYDQHWRADNPAVHVQGVECAKNLLLNVRLTPGEAYERALSVSAGIAAEELQQESITFRLGFQPWADEAAQSPSLIWSNPVTVKVKK